MICGFIKSMAAHSSIPHLSSIMIAPALVPRKDAPFDLYPYTPSAVAGYAFLVLFAVGGFAHLCMIFSLRAWFFVPFILGCAGKPSRLPRPAYTPY